MKQAIVGVREDGEVRAVFCIDSPKAEYEAQKVSKQWEMDKRVVYRCSEEHAFKVSGKQWVEESK